MGETPTTENKTAGTVNSVIDDVVKAAETTAAKAAEVAIETAAPVPFALPVIREIEEFTVEQLVKYLGDKISLSLQQIGTFLVIDTQVSTEKKSISKELAAVMLAEQSGDPNAIRKAIQDYANAQSSLVHDDGSAPPRV